MIITKSWLNEWIDLRNISTDEIAKTLNSIGLEVDRVHNYRVPEKIVFGQVLECQKHPDADKLNICQVDLGAMGVKQIVCGAANVRAGLRVVVATLGAVMPNGMEIKPVKLRGVDSQGMICSAGEIGLPEIGKGIVELDGSVGDCILGEEVSTNLYFNDDLIEIELTANRGDCLSICGVARDLSAALDRPLKEYTSEDNDDRRGIGRVVALTHEKELDISVEYKALELQNLALPFLVKLRLAQIEQTYTNDIDAILAYTTHATGVILHAYPQEFFAQEQSVAKIVLSEDSKGFSVVKNIDGVIASYIGVKQNEESYVTQKQGIILLEASYIAPDKISKEIAENKIAVGDEFYRTSRGSEPSLELGIAYCTDLLESTSQTTTFSGVVSYTTSVKEHVVIVTKQEIDAIIGADIDKVTITKIFKNLGFDTSKSSTDNFVITIPQFRHDIVNKQDVIEELVRMVGIDNIPSKPFVLQEDNRLEDNYFAYKKRSVYRHKAAQSGFFESVHFVFDEKKVLQEYGFNTTKDELELLNPIVQTLDTLRPTLLTGLLKAASQNVKNGYSSVRLFEIGSVFTPERNESLRMSFIFSGDKEQESLLNGGKPAKIDFGSFVQKIADIIGDVTLKESKPNHKLAHDFQVAQVIQNGVVVGELFKLHPTVQKVYDLDVTYMCELDFSQLQFGLKTAQKRSKYQASFRDLSLLVPKKISYEQIKDVIEKHATDELIRFYPVDRYEDESLGDNISLSLRFVLQSDEKTLQEEDITKAMESILQGLQTTFGIGLR